MELKQKAFAGVRWTATSSVAVITLSFLQLVILARLLEPSDFGLIAIAMALTAIGAVLSDLGIGQTLLHRRDVSESELSSIYWLLLLAASVTSGCIALFAFGLSSVYGNVELARLVSLTAVTLPAAAPGRLFRVMAEKAFRFNTLAVIEIACASTSVFAAVGAAVYGAGAYSVAVGALAASILGSCLSWRWLSHDLRPTWPPRIRGLRYFLGTGFLSMATSLVNSVRSQIDILLGALLMSPAQVGIYSTSKQLVLRAVLIMNPIVTRVATPSLSLLQAHPQQAAQLFAQVMRAISFFSAPAFFLAFAFSDYIVLVVLGSDWSAAGEPLRLLLLWGWLVTVGNPVGSLLVAFGRFKRALVWNVGTLCFLAAVVLTGQWGPTNLAAAYCVAYAVLQIPAWAFLVKPICGLSLGAYLLSFGLPAVVASLALSFALAVQSWIPSPLPGAVAALVTYLLLYTMAAILFMPNEVRLVSSLLFAEKLKLRLPR